MSFETVQTLVFLWVSKVNLDAQRREWGLTTLTSTKSFPPTNKEKEKPFALFSRQWDRTDIHKPVISLCSNQSTLFHFLSFLLGKQLPPCCLFSCTTGVKQENQTFWIANEPTENKEILFYSLTNFWIGFFVCFAFKYRLVYVVVSQLPDFMDGFLIFLKI